MSDDQPTETPKTSRGVGTGVFNKALDMMDRSAQRDAARDSETAQHNKVIIKWLIIVIIISYVVFAMVVAGLLHSGVKGTVGNTSIEVTGGP